MLARQTRSGMEFSVFDVRKIDCGAIIAEPPKKYGAGSLRGCSCKCEREKEPLIGSQHSPLEEDAGILGPRLASHRFEKMKEDG